MAGNESMAATIDSANIRRQVQKRMHESVKGHISSRQKFVNIVTHATRYTGMKMLHFPCLVSHHPAQIEGRVPFGII